MIAGAGFFDTLQRGIVPTLVLLSIALEQWPTR